MKITRSRGKYNNSPYFEKKNTLKQLTPQEIWKKLGIHSGHFKVFEGQSEGGADNAKRVE